MTASDSARLCGCLHPIWSMYPQMLADQQLRCVLPRRCGRGGAGTHEEGPGHPGEAKKCEASPCLGCLCLEDQSCVPECACVCVVLL